MFPLDAMSINKKSIDFNFPQDVSKEALVDLDKALKAGDGQSTVDALVRYGIAQSQISQDNMADIVSRIESVIVKEKQPHIRALLYYFEAIAYADYRDRYARWSGRHNPTEEMPDDVSEWNRDQFNVKIAQLVNKSLSEPDALKQVLVTSLSGILEYNQLGSTMVPTLLEFMTMKDIELLEGIDNLGPEIDRLKKMWLDVTEGNVPAHIFAITQTGESVNKEVYQKYQDSEYSALLLERISLYDNKEMHKLLKEYVERFPSSIHTPCIKNKITELEEKTVSVRYPSVRSTRDSIPVTISSQNANRFNINVYQVPEALMEDYQFSINQLKLVKQYPMTAQGTVPFSDNSIKATLPPLPCGAYVLCGDNFDGDKKSVNNDLHNYDIMRVSDIALIVINRDDKKDHIGAVDVNTGKPIQGVSINYQMNRDHKGTVGKTDVNGLLTPPETCGDERSGDKYIPFVSARLSAIKGEDRYSQPITYHRIQKNTGSNQSANIYTDLGVYRPGETLKWAAIAYATDGDKRTPLAGRKLRMSFKDSNNKLIDTCTVTSDEYGRIEGSFAVPKDRMNGFFRLMLEFANAGKYQRSLAYKGVNISEYKTPTFAVTFPEAPYSYTAGQPVKVSGKVETYSGMPVANTTVRLSLIMKEWSWWWWRNIDKNGEHLMDTTVTTDAQGVFTFSFAPNLFRENNGYTPGRRCWSRNHYMVVATATTDAGETQEESTSFIVGTRRGIELGIQNNNVYLNDKPIKLPLKYNTTDETNTSVWCTWAVTPIGGEKPVLTGNLNTDDPTIDLTSLASGQYSLEIHILDAEEGEQDVTISRDITLYRKSDKVPPVKDCPLWISPLSGNVDNKNIGHITVGVSVPQAYIYYVASTADKVIGEGWLKYNKGLNDLALQLPREAGANVRVQFVTYYNTQLWSEETQIINPYKAEAVKITATSFRDKLSPGDVEHWTFTLTDQNGKPHRGAMLLDMFDKALAGIAPNSWGFNNLIRYNRTASLSAVGLAGNQSTYAHWMGKMLDIPNETNIIPPHLHLYGMSLFNNYHYERDMVFSNKAMLGETRSFRTLKSDEKGGEVQIQDELVAEGESADEVTVNENELGKVQLRENDVKTALWQPMLTSDDKGVISLEFEVPNFNTTWITQAVAWDQKMLGDTWMAEVLTQKPLMVRSNMPRFLRQGDRATLAATVQNATDQVSAADAVIELFDPRTGDIYDTRKFNLQLDPMGSQVVTVDWQVPDTIAIAGFRIKAANGRYGDGEQVMVPVLTTISPVIETEPFYIEAAQSHYEAILPKFPADARVTLEYCDNPTWYCVLALPTIFSGNYKITTHAVHSLFALQVAQGVAKSQPQIKEAITYWKEHNEDSTLVSMLEKNQDLKIGTLLASPWVREADRQTLRMSRLNELFDENITTQEYEKIITALQTLQMSDGGFTWFVYPGCKSNLWTTGTVLETLGDIKHLGFLPDDNRLTSMINRALKYYDNENVRLYNEMRKYSNNPLASFTEYAYTRSLFPEAKPDKASDDLLKKTVKHMEKNWSKGITLRKKAYYAMTLNRNGYEKTARRIVESIRQFAMVKPNLGMYWDNLQTGNGWWELDKVAYTATILRTMNEVDPRQDEIDQIRKWMLLMKQSNDWGSYSLAADAVNSILSTGSQWHGRNATPVITVAGNPVNLDKMAEWLGYFRTTLDASTTGTVTIDRTGQGPAWGAVYTQFKAPMTTIQEKSIDEISISKEYYVYHQDGSLHQATSFKVGDKVKVRVIIKTNKDMDFVTMTDERTSCFEPVDQLSGYRNEDGAWFYQETKDSQTNIFFTSLNKGTHIIGYDVWVTNPGQFTSGIATVQCQYAPQLSAHSAGKSITIVSYK